MHNHTHKFQDVDPRPVGHPNYAKFGDSTHEK